MPLGITAQCVVFVPNSYFFMGVSLKSVGYFKKMPKFAASNVHYFNEIENNG